MRHVYLLRRHSMHPYENQAYLRAFEIVKVYANKGDARVAAEDKNNRPLRQYFYSVQQLRLPEDKQ